MRERWVEREPGRGVGFLEQLRSGGRVMGWLGKRVFYVRFQVEVYSYHSLGGGGKKGVVVGEEEGLLEG